MPKLSRERTAAILPGFHCRSCDGNHLLGKFNSVCGFEARSTCFAEAMLRDLVRRDRNPSALLPARFWTSHFLRRMDALSEDHVPFVAGFENGQTTTMWHMVIPHVSEVMIQRQI